eukprot:1035436-Prymnesium_polylepis.1
MPLAGRPVGRRRSTSEPMQPVSPGHSAELLLRSHSSRLIGCDADAGETHTRATAGPPPPPLACACALRGNCNPPASMSAARDGAPF